jgi:hypothetical protein
VIEFNLKGNEYVAPSCGYGVYSVLPTSHNKRLLFSKPSKSFLWNVFNVPLEAIVLSMPQKLGLFKLNSARRPALGNPGTCVKQYPRPWVLFDSLQALKRAESLPASLSAGIRFFLSFSSCSSWHLDQRRMQAYQFEVSLSNGPWL